jgi:hypothetical protein
MSALSLLFLLQQQEWDLSTAEEVNVLREHTSSVSSLATSPSMLYSGSLECNDVFYRAIEDTSSPSSSHDMECLRVSRHSDSIL